MVKDTQTIRGQQPTNYLSVFDHFVGLALKGLKKLLPTIGFSENTLATPKAKLRVYWESRFY